MVDTVKIYVVLLEEGTDTIRGTQAIPLGSGLYKLLPTPDYDPEDEVWEFLPGTVVRGVMVQNKVAGPLLKAYAQDG